MINAFDLLTGTYRENTYHGHRVSDKSFAYWHGVNLYTLSHLKTTWPPYHWHKDLDFVKISKA